jgi:starch synthase (maltosyl-transferring)
MLRNNEGRKRVVIETVAPDIDAGRFPIKRVTGERVSVSADIFADGHDVLSACLLFRGPQEKAWREAPMRFVENDRWQGSFMVEKLGDYFYTVLAWVDYFKTWQRDLRKRVDAGQDVDVDMLIGAGYVDEATGRAHKKERATLAGFARHMRAEQGTQDAIEIALSDELSGIMEQYTERQFSTRFERELAVVVERPKALFSSWYEMFPRSCPSQSGHGTFRDCEALLPEIAKMGFDVVYFPPIHPIGRTKRKGRNNTLDVTEHDVGSAWAIGAEEGGHTAVHPDLGTIEDYRVFIEKAGTLGIEVAMDLAFQCSPDHPYVKEHPDWFNWRPDGTVQYAENPPKKYEDILPLKFDTEHWEELWEELRRVVLFWIEQGVRIFRVDNPHTKPFEFWEWLIEGVRKDYPDVIFLSEAFTRPKVMYRLAKIGFTQSYTYFTWRNTKRELAHYIDELAKTQVSEYFRPNFWPNTPDILPEHLQYGGRNAFMLRLVLAATLSSNYGIYGPAYELTVNEAIEGKEEYLNSEKYEIKHWERNSESSLKDFVSRINRIRRENPALQRTFNIQHYDADNENIFVYGKTNEDLSNLILVVVNLDPFHTHSGWLQIPIREFGIDPDHPYLVHDLIGDDKFIWQGERNYVEINPHISPAYIFRVRIKMKKETDFDYFL